MRHRAPRGACTGKLLHWILRIQLCAASLVFQAHANFSGCGLPDAVPPERRSNIVIEGQEVPFGIVPLAWTSGGVMASVADILLSEILGINTTMLPPLISVVSGYYSVCGCQTPDDASDRGCGSRFSRAHVVLETWANSVDTIDAAFQTEFGDIAPEFLGKIGYPGREGIYVPSRPKNAAYAAEGLSLDYYKSYNISWFDPKQYFDSIDSIDATDLLPCSQTRMALAQSMEYYLQFTGDAGGVEVVDGAYVGKCQGGLEGSWWFSPACRSNPETCIPVLTSGDGWSVVSFMMKAANFNMPLALAVGTWSKYADEPRLTTKPFYWWYPDTTFADLDPASIVFPTNDPAAWARGDKTTASVDVPLGKYVHHAVAGASSRAHEFIQNIEFSLSHIEPMMLEAKMNPSKTEAELACEWLHANQDIWQAWIPFETKCPEGWGLVDILGEHVDNRTLAASCDWCSAGRVSEEVIDEAGKTRICTSCPEGKHQNMPGQMLCLNCTTGTYAGQVGMSICEECPAGTANDEEGRSDCIPCAPGSFQSSEGSSSCTPCAGGTFIDSVSSTACDPCPPGMFSEPNAVECQNCSAGYAAAEEGSSSCIACSLGHFSPDAGAATCTACPIGEHASTRGRSACERCGAGAPLWTTMRKLEVQGSYQWVTTDAAKTAEACGCDVGSRFDADGNCVQCDTVGIECPGMGEVVLLPGYYSAPSPLSVFECKSTMNCVGGPPGAMCADLRIGLACARCEDGTSADSGGACVPCDSGDRAPFAILIVCVMAMFVGLYLTLARKDGGEPGYVGILIGISGGLLVGLMQQLSIVGFLDVKYSEPIHTFLSIARIFAFDVENIIHLDCIGSISAVAHFITKVCMIFACGIFVLLIHVVFVLVRRRGRFRDSNPILIAVFGTIVMIFYISVTVTIMQPLQCNWNPNGKWTVQAYEEVICWDHEEDGDHPIMLVVGLLALAIPVSLFVKVIMLVRKLPVAMRHNNISFMRSYGFLFFRFRPQAHWYILVVMTRSLLIGLVPVIPQAVAQIYTLQLILLSTLLSCVHYKPWRISAMNWMDELFGGALILFMNICAFFVHDANVEALGWVCVCMISVCIALMPAFLVFSIRKKIGHGVKPYQFFLCHCKADAGALARWLKMELVGIPQVRREVFLDSDNLDTLDLLLSYVAADVDTLVVIASEAVFFRPWCLGEMATAHLNNVNAIVLASPAYKRMDADTIASLDSVVPDLEMLFVDCGLRMDLLKDAIAVFSAKEALALPSLMTESSMVGLGKALVSGQRSGEIVSTRLRHSVALKIAIVCDDHCEAVASAHVLQKLLVPLLCHDIAFIPEVLDPGSQEAIPASVAKVILLCTQECFGSMKYLDRVLEIGDRNLVTMPVIGDDEFRVPKPDSFDALRADALPRAPDGQTRSAREVSVVVSQIFKEIAVPLRAKHERISALESGGHRVATRVLKGFKHSGTKHGTYEQLACSRAGQGRSGSLADSQEKASDTWEAFERDIGGEEDEDSDFAVDDEGSVRELSATFHPQSYLAHSSFLVSTSHQESYTRHMSGFAEGLEASMVATAARDRYNAEKMLDLKERSSVT